jgi:hypothetical protein
MLDQPHRELLKRAAWPLLFLTFSYGLYLYFSPSRGYQEMLKSQEALRHVKSWRSIGSEQGLVNAWRDVNCPADFSDTYVDPNEHLVTRRAAVSGISYQQRSDGSWLRTTSPQDPVSDCGKGPYVRGIGFLYPPLDEIERNGEIRKGDWEKTEHGKCRYWSLIPAKGAPPRYSVCLDESTHLPIRIGTGAGGVSYTFWDWDAATIAPPVPE